MCSVGSATNSVRSGIGCSAYSILGATASSVDNCSVLSGIVVVVASGTKVSVDSNSVGIRTFSTDLARRLKTYE